VRSQVFLFKQGRIILISLITSLMIFSLSCTSPWPTTSASITTSVSTQVPVMPSSTVPVSATPSVSSTAVNTAAAPTPTLPVNSPSSTPAIPVENSVVLSIMVNLKAGDEIPAITSTASAQLLLNINSSTAEMSFKLTAADITNVTMAHLHLGVAGQNGPPVVWLYPLTGAPQEISGVFNGVLSEGIITAANFVGPLQGQPFGNLIDKIKTGDIYANIHTVQNPAGEIRGQVIYPAQSISTPTNYIETFGVIKNISGNVITVIGSDNILRSVTLTQDTWIQRVDGTRGSNADLAVGGKIELYTSLDLKNLYKVEIRDPNNIANGFVSGKIGTPTSGFIVDNTGRVYNLQMTTFTVILRANGTRGSSVDLLPGTPVEVYYNNSTKVVFKIEIES
jgi:hypothetical protein